MKGTTSYSKELNLILDYLNEEGTIEDAIEIKALSVAKGVVKPGTRILALLESKQKLGIEDLREFGTRLKEDLPEYAGTRTALVTREVGTTTGGLTISKALETMQDIGVFSTTDGAIEFLDVTFEEIEAAFPEMKGLLERFRDR